MCDAANLECRSSSENWSHKRQSEKREKQTHIHKYMSFMNRGNSKIVYSYPGVTYPHMQMGKRMHENMHLFRSFQPNLTLVMKKRCHSLETIQWTKRPTNFQHSHNSIIKVERLLHRTCTSLTKKHSRFG